MWEVVGQGWTPHPAYFVSLSLPPTHSLVLVNGFDRREFAELLNLDEQIDW